MKFHDYANISLRHSILALKKGKSQQDSKLFVPIKTSMQYANLGKSDHMIKIMLENQALKPTVIDNFIHSSDITKRD
jgi:hypothetical protein